MYFCADCKQPATILGNEIQRTCTHDVGVIAELSATCSGDGSLENKNSVRDWFINLWSKLQAVK